jgi:hypothetical protein
MSDDSEMLILYPASSVDRLRARIEALEAALREVFTNEIMVARKIARAALDKDAGK